MKNLALLLIFFSLLVFESVAQGDLIIPGAKSLKTEHSPVPKEFKTKKLPHSSLDSACFGAEPKYGTWFKLFPATSQLRVIVSVGYSWGDLADPTIYLAYVDTVNGESALKVLGCSTYVGNQGDFALEWFNLVPRKKHYLLIAGTNSKERFALYLTEKFTKTEDNASSGYHDKTEAFELKEPTISGGFSNEVQEEQLVEKSAVVMGRIRGQNGSPMAGFPVVLLDDDLKEDQSAVTDETGVFRIEGVDPDRINLIRMEAEDAKLLVDMFLYDADVNVLGKGLSIGHRLYSFEPKPPVKPQFQVLSEKDMVVMVKKGRSSMSGKVVDRKTYLIGREGVRIGLYTTNKQLLRTAISDRNGMFMFTQLTDVDYIVKVDHNPGDDYVEIVLTDDKNMPYAVSTSSDQAADGYFRFRKLPKDAFQITAIEEIDLSGFKHHYYNDLSKEDVGERLELKTIQFSVGAFHVPDQSDELDQLAKDLKKLSTMRIEVSGHTDNSGSERQNVKISQRRADAVKAYLVGKGIDPARIDCIGRGSSVPLLPNDTPFGRQQNRRVELTILSR